MVVVLVVVAEVLVVAVGVVAVGLAADFVVDGLILAAACCFAFTVVVAADLAAVEVVAGAERWARLVGFAGAVVRGADAWVTVGRAVGFVVVTRGAALDRGVAAYPCPAACSRSTTGPVFACAIVEVSRPSWPGSADHDVRPDVDDCRDHVVAGAVGRAVAESVTLYAVAASAGPVDSNRRDVGIAATASAVAITAVARRQRSAREASRSGRRV